MAKKLSRSDIFILSLLLVVALGNFLIITIANDKQVYHLSKELEIQAEELYKNKEFKKSKELYEKALKNYDRLTLYKFFVKSDIKRIKEKLLQDENFIKISQGYIYFEGKWINEEKLRNLLKEKDELIKDIEIILKTAESLDTLSSIENDIKVYEKGLKLIENSKFKDDSDIIGLRKKITAKLFQLYTKAAKKFEKLGEIEKSIDYYQKALSIKENDTIKRFLYKNYLILVNRFIKENKFLEALKLTLKAKELGVNYTKTKEKIREIVARIDPDKIKNIEDPFVYYLLAEKALENNNLKNAGQLCEKMLRLGKKDRDTYLLCGKIFYLSGDYKRSIQLLNHITEADKQTELLKGKVLFNMKIYTEAIPYLEKFKDNKDIQKYLFISYKNIGLNLLNESKEKGVEYLSKALSIKEDFEIYKALGNIYFAEKDYEKAYKFYKKALTLNPELKKEITNSLIKLSKILGDKNLKNKRYKEALSLYLEALKYSPKDVKVIEKIGDIYSRLGNKKAAIKQYENIFKLNKTYFNTRVADKLLNLRMELGDIYFAGGDYEKAIYHYKKALVFSEDDRLIEKLAKAYLKIGDKYLKKKDYETAFNYYVKGISLKPSLDVAVSKNLGKAYIGIGEIRYKRGEYKKAIKYLSKGEKFLPEDYKVYYYKGLSYLKIGETDDAIKNLEKAIEKNSSLYDVDLILIELYFKKGKLSEAEKYIDKLIKAGKFLSKVYMLKGDILLKKGDIDNAFKYYIKAEENGNRSGDVYFKIAYVYFKKKNHLKTVSYATKAIKNNYTEKDVYYIRGLSYYNLKDYKNAIKDLSAYLKKNPKDANIYFLRGKIYYEHGDFSKGDYGRAISDIKKAVALGHKEAEKYLKKIENK
ncbi:tetratricopeptide repeat protein [Persephonella sp.]